MAFSLFGGIILLIGKKMLKRKSVINIEDIAQLVKASRKKQGLTQEELAGLSNTGARFIVDLEKAKPSCQIAKVLLVLRVLGINLQVQDEQE